MAALDPEIPRFKGDVRGSEADSESPSASSKIRAMDGVMLNSDPLTLTPSPSSCIGGKTHYSVKIDSAEVEIITRPFLLRNLAPSFF